MSGACEFEEIYDELRALAAGWYRARRPGDTLQPTALVHEAYLKLAAAPDRELDAEHFKALAARALRQALVTHLRARGTQKRGADWERVTLSGLATDPSSALDMLELDAALQELEVLEPRHARLVELRFFGGLTIEECAKALEVGLTTVKADWRQARRFLYSRLRGGGEALP